MSPSLPLRLLSLLLVGLLLLVTVPILLLATYNHASPVDDYCFADTVLKYGFWQAQHFYYHGWTGRYFHNFIVHASPLSMGWLGGYKFIPVLMLALLGFAWYRLGRAVAPSRWMAALFMAAMLLLSITTMPSVAEFFFWLTGIAGYSLPCVLLILWLVRVYRRDQGQLPGTFASMLVDCLFIAALVGSSETSTAWLLAWLGLLTLGKWLQTRTEPGSVFKLMPGYVWVYWTVAVVSILFLVLAPGNAIRLGANPKEHDVVALLTGSARYTIQFVGYRLLHTPLLPLSLLHIPVAYQLTALGQPLRAYASLPLGLILLHTAATVWGLVFLHYWAVGIEPAARVQNLIDHALLLGWLYTLTVLVRVLRPRLESVQAHTLNPALIGFVGVSLLLLIWRSQPPRTMIADLTSGRAKKYNAAMDDRYKLLAQPGSDTLVLAPLPAAPVSLVIEDIRTDPTHLWNKCWAGYFHQKAVVLSQ